MNSIRTKITLLTVCIVIIALGIATVIGLISIKKLGRNDADQMLHLTATTGALNLESYFESVEHSVETVATLVQGSFDGMPFEDLEAQVERNRNLFERIAYNTNGVLTYYFRIDPEISDTVKGFWYVNQDGKGFQEHEVTDISQYDTNDTSELVWFTVPKATGKGVWLPPYNTENLGARVISYNVPVYWQNQFIGVIGIEIDYDTLAQEVENIKIFDSGYAFILDEDSNVIYHPQIDDSGQLNLETTALSDTDRFIGSNHVQYNYEGVEKEAVWIPLSNGMRLYVAAPVSEIDSGWRGMIWNILIAALVVLAISCIVALRFSGHLTKPLRDLTVAAKQVQNGNYESDLEYNKNDEVGILTQTFKELTAHTKENLTTARRMAAVDPLTGVKNKSSYTQWEERINEEIKKGDKESFAVVVCDINNLKAVNDLYGHKEGDTCIKNACDKICGVFSHSPVFRIGGDEFVVILSGEDFIVRNKLVEQINAVPRDHSKIRMGETVSAGMAEYKKGQHLSLSSVFEDADKAMYERKQFLKENVLPKDTKDSESAYEYIPVIHTRKQILVVDDVEMNREIMGDLLQDDYDILYASDGVEALDVLRSHTGEIDLVLLDLLMPNKSGREVISEMQVDEDLMSVPVLVLTSDQEAELDCLKIGAMDFISKPLPDIDIVKARISKCIELSEDRDLIQYTERDKLTGLLNKDYFFRYVDRLDHLYKDQVLDAVVFDVNRFHSLNKQYGRQLCDRLLGSIGNGIRRLARKTGGIGCRKEGDTFLLYCLHQDDYEGLLREFVSEISADNEIADMVNLRVGVYVDAQREPEIEERFARAIIAADRVKDNPDAICGFYAE
jgi:diguanylate cyclase (GGDEF)-like protein